MTRIHQIAHYNLKTEEPLVSKTYTLGEILDAIEKNGFIQTRASFIIRNDNADVIGACAVGQGAINLEIMPAFLASMLGEWHTNGFGSLAGWIYEMNDVERLPIPEIVERVRDKFALRLEEKTTMDVAIMRVER